MYEGLLESGVNGDRGFGHLLIDIFHFRDLLGYTAISCFYE